MDEKKLPDFSAIPCFMLTPTIFFDILSAKDVITFGRSASDEKTMGYSRGDPSRTARLVK